MVTLVAFLIIGPYSFFGRAISIDFGGKQGSDTASGIIDGVGYRGRRIGCGQHGTHIRVIRLERRLHRADDCRVSAASKEDRRMNVQQLDFEEDRVSITWEDGHRSEYASIWLLDNAPEHRDARTGQRLIDVCDLPENPRIAGASDWDGALVLAWADRRISTVPLDWLRAECPCCARSGAEAPRLWSGADAGILRRFAWDEVQASAAIRLEWLRAIADQGIAFLSGVPAEENAVLDVARLVGWVRETNYGRVFDVRAVPHPNNLAYTGLSLGLHTDNPYRDPVPGLQLLHTLCAGDKGGDSIFADGFAIAESLRAEAPSVFNALTRTPVRFEFSDDQCHLEAERTIIETTRDGRIAAIHYNNRSIAPLRLAADRIAEFYGAYRAFASLLWGARFPLTTRLAEGELVASNNRRVLHGRTAFFASGPRHLQGCYVDADGLQSNISVLERERGRHGKHCGTV